MQNNNIFLEFASSTSANQVASLDKHFLSSYFRVPGMTYSEETKLFSDLVSVMENFIEFRLLSSSSPKIQREQNEDSAMIDDLVVPPSQNEKLIPLLRSTAQVLQKHAEKAGITKEAAKALFSILSLSPLNNFEKYIPVILQSIPSSGDSSTCSSSNNNCNNIQPNLLSTEKAKETILSCLPWDRLCPLLVECRNIISESKNNIYDRASDASFSMILDVNSSNQQSQIAHQPQLLWNVTRNQEETLDQLELSIALHTMTQQREIFLLNHSKKYQSQSYFSGQTPSWANNLYHDNHNNNNFQKKSPELATIGHKLFADSSSAPPLQPFTENESLWNSDPSPWATKLLFPSSVINNDDDVVAVDKNPTPTKNANEAYQDETVNIENTTNNCRTGQQQRIDFFKIELPANSVDGKSSSCWSSIWKALHRAVIGHGDTLGIVGPKQLHSSSDAAKTTTASSKIEVRITCWPPSLSFVPSLLSRFTECGTLHLRLRRLVEVFLRSSSSSSSSSSNIVAQKFGSIGKAIIYAVQDELRKFENEVLKRCEEVSISSRKVNHSMILKRASQLQKEFVPKITLLAEFFGVTSGDHHGNWTVKETILFGEEAETNNNNNNNSNVSGIQLLNRIYRWLVNFEHVNGIQFDESDDNDDDDCNDDNNNNIENISITQKNLYEMIKKIFLAGLTQFHKKVVSWIRKGFINDPYQEFFLSNQQQQRQTGNKKQNQIAELRRNDAFTESDNKHNDLQFLQLFVPEFFSCINLDLIRNAGIAQLLLQSERKFGVVNVMWDEVDRADLKLWPRLFLCPSARENWFFFIERAVPESIMIMSAHSPLRDLQNAFRKRRKELAFMKEGRERQEMISDKKSTYRKMLLENNNNNNNNNSVTDLRKPPITRRRNEENVEDNESYIIDDDKGKTKSQIWNEYMEQAKQDAVKELLEQHEAKMAASRLRSEKIAWKNKRIGLTALRLEAIKNEKDLLVGTLIEFVQSGRERIAVPVFPLISQIPEYYAINQHPLLIDDNNNNEVQEDAAPPNEKCKNDDVDEKQEVNIAVDQQDSSSSSMSQHQPEQQKFSSRAKWNHYARNEITRIGEKNPKFSSFSNNNNEHEITTRSFEPDFNWNPMQERVGKSSHQDFTSPEDAAAKIFEETESFVQRQLEKQQNQTQDLWSVAKSNGKFGVSSWASDVIISSSSPYSSMRRNDNFTLSSKAKKFSSQAGDIDGDDDDDDDDEEEETSHLLFDEVEKNSSISDFRVSSLSHRYRILLLPLCQQLIHRSLRVSLLEDSSGLLRSVVDALNSCCLLQSSKAAVDLQDRLLDVIFVAPTSSAAASVNNNLNVTQRIMINAKPTSRLSSCNLIWKNFWNFDLVGDHAKFLNISLDFSSTLYNKINNSNGNSNSLNGNNNIISPLMILQFAKLSPQYNNDNDNNNNSVKHQRNEDKSDDDEDGNDATKSRNLKQFFDVLLPDRCIDRYGRAMFALLTWTIIDRMCVQLWRVSGTRLGNLNNEKNRIAPRKYFTQEEIDQEENENDGDDDDSELISEEEKQRRAASAVSAALWEFVTISRGVLMALREHIWHGVCTSFRKYSAKLSDVNQQQGDYAENNRYYNFDDFRNSLEILLTETHEACCLAESQKDLRRTISVLMRIVEQVYSAIVLVGGNNEGHETSFAALARVPPIVLQQQTEQFILAAKTLESQVVAMTVAASGGSTANNNNSSNITSLFNVVSAIRTALPRNF